MPEIPNLHAGVMLLITVFALLLFSRDKIPLETSSLAVLTIIIVFFELVPYAIDGGTLQSAVFFSGFGHEALVAVAGLMICGQGLVATGALLPVGRGIARLWRTSPMLSLLLTLSAGAIGSAFVNNTPIVVLLIPILANVAARNKSSAGPWLMPMNFSTLLGGAATTIGTSTNLLVVAVAADLGLPKFAMFDFILPASIAGGIGLLYLWLIAPRILARKTGATEDTAQRDFIFQLSFPAESASIGRTVAELQKIAHGQLEILRLRRAEKLSTGSGAVPLPDALIRPGDRITGRSSADDVKELEAALDAVVVGHEADEKKDDDIELAQLVVMDNSGLVGRKLAVSHFSASYQIKVLAIHRATQRMRTLRDGVNDVVIQTGDILLVEGSRENIDELKNEKSLLILDERKSLPTENRGWLAIAILVAVVATAAVGILPIATSSVCGALLMLITGCIDWRDVGQALSIPVIMIVVVSLAMGAALTQTGATSYIAELFLYVFSGATPAVILSALILMMAVLTNIVSNNAAAVIGTPIAISLATQLGVPPQTFVLAVLFGANLSFVTPMAYKTNVLVMSAGDYTFMDFVKVGLPLAVLLWGTYTVVLPMIYGL